MRLLSTISIVCVSAFSLAAEPMTMEQAVELAVANSFGVQQAQVASSRTVSDVEAAEATLGPKVNATANYNQSQGQGTGGGGNDWTEQKNIGLAVSQSIDISGSLGAAIRAAKNFKDAAEWRLAAAKNTVKQQVRVAYIGALRAQELLEIQQAQLSSARGRYENAMKRYQQGDIPRFDTLRLENEVKRAEKGVLDAEGIVKLAKQVVNNIIGRAIETEFEVVPIPQMPILGHTSTELVTKAIQDRPDLKSLRATLSALKYVQIVTGSGMKPRLNASLTHTRNIDPSPGFNDNSTFAGLNLTWPVWDNGQANAQGESARLNTVEAEIGLQQAQLGVALEVYNSNTEFDTAMRGLILAQSSVDLAQEALRLAQLLYDEEQGILLDVIVGQNDLTTAKAGLADARYAVRLAYAKLQGATANDELSGGVE